METLISTNKKFFFHFIRGFSYRQKFDPQEANSVMQKKLPYLKGFVILKEFWNLFSFVLTL